MNAAEPISYAQVDPIVNAWADGHRLRVFTKYEGRETRAVRIPSRFGDSHVICVTPDLATGLVTLKVESADGVARRAFRWRRVPLRHFENVELADLAVALGDLTRALNFRLLLPSISATAGERFSAFLMDAIILSAAQSALLYVTRHPEWGEMLSSWGFPIFVAYGTIFESSPLRATPGKWLTGFYLATVEGGAPPWRQCLLRNVTRILSLLPFGAGYLSVNAAGSLGQAFHDKISRCVVVRRGAEFPLPQWKPNFRAESASQAPSIT
jgi:uncharacterized RDD family membrane protein YckC